MSFHRIVAANWCLQAWETERQDVLTGEIQGLRSDVALGRQFLSASEAQARAASVHSSAILEALRKVYSAAPLVEELLKR